MIVPLLLLLAAPPGPEPTGAPIGLHLEATEGVPKPQLNLIVVALKKSFATKANAPLVVDRKVGPCAGDAACLAAVRERTKAKSIVMLTVKSKGEIPDVSLELLPGGGGEPRKASVVLDAQAAEWAGLLTPLVVSVTSPPGGAVEAVAGGPPAGASSTPPIPGAEPAPAPGPETPGTPPVAAAPEAAAPAPEAAAPSAPAQSVFVSPSLPEEPEKKLNPWPLAVIGGSVALGVVGVVFGAQAASARGDLVGVDHAEPSEVERLNDDALTKGSTANVLFGAAIVGAAAGLVWWMID